MAVAKKPAAGKAAKNAVSPRSASAKGKPEAKKRPAAAAKSSAKAAPKKAAPAAKKAAGKPAPAKGKAAPQKASAKPAATKAAPAKKASSKAPAKKAAAPAKKAAAPAKSSGKKAAPTKPAASSKVAAKPAAKKTAPKPAKVSKPATKNPARKVVMPKAKPASKTAAKAKAQAKPAAKTAAKKTAPKQAPVAKAAAKPKLPTPKKNTTDVPAKKATAPAKPQTVKAGPNPVKDSPNVKSLAKDVTPMPTKTKDTTIDTKSLKSAGPAAQVQPASKPGRKLKPEELNKLRSMLHQERERIIEEMRILDDRSLTANPEDTESPQPGFSLQLADSATDNIQVETDLAIRNIEAEQLSQIDDALRSIDLGEYGICNRCHQAIDFERLKAKPNARYCVSCLRLLESGKA